MKNDELAKLRRRFLGPDTEEGSAASPVAVNPAARDVTVLRTRLRELPEEDLRFARLDFAREVNWIEHAAVGNPQFAPHVLRAAGCGYGWFAHLHPSPRALLARMLLRARAFDDTKAEETLLRLAIDFPTVFAR